MKVLVVDIGGSNIKFLVWQVTPGQRFPSGKSMTPTAAFDRITSILSREQYDVVSIGFPGPVMHGQPAGDPPNLGPGWVEFNYEGRLGKPVKVINDAAMQALGSYQGGRMLFLGLGTGVGSALIVDNVILPLELGELEFGNGRSLAETLGSEAMKTTGNTEWETNVHRAIARLSRAFRTDYIVLGGGHAKRLRDLPKGTLRGSNKNAFIGGARLWGIEKPSANPRKHTWILA